MNGTTENWTDPATGITWTGTGEVLDRVSVYDWEEIVEGVDDMGNEYKASASVSCGEIQDIYEPGTYFTFNFKSIMSYIKGEMPKNFRKIKKEHTEMYEALKLYISDLKNIVPQSKARDNRIAQMESLLNQIEL